MPKTRPVAIAKVDEPWMFIHLADGTVLKHRRIVTGALQLLDDNGEPVIDENGMGQYALQCHDIQIVESSPMIEERQTTNNNIRKN
jgi:hypothetical protein